MGILTDFSEKFRTSELAIHNSDYWLVSLRPAQVTPGSLVLSLKRESTSLADLSASESAELTLVCQWIEKALGETFGAEKFNYLALMMVDPQVHFHVIPRYSAAVRVGSSLYSDNNWPGPPNILKSQDIDLTEVKQALEKHSLL